jgi:hypothetical protein
MFMYSIALEVVKQYPPHYKILRQNLCLIYQTNLTLLLTFMFFVKAGLFQIWCMLSSLNWVKINYHKTLNCTLLLGFVNCCFWWAVKWTDNQLKLSAKKIELKTTGQIHLSQIIFNTLFHIIIRLKCNNL